MLRTLCAVDKSMRSILGSAVSFFISACIIHTIACKLDPSFSLLLTRGVGKVTLMLAALIQIGCFLAIQPVSFARKIWNAAVMWPFRSACLQTFFSFFILFSVIHIAVIGVYICAGYGAYNSTSLSLLPGRVGALIIGLCGTFLLAWSEECIFRGFLFEHLSRYLSVFSSAVLSSGIFSILHDLHNPLSLVTTQWQLGLGLFYLVCFLTYLNLWKNSLAASAGAHAGLVFIKVVLRKVPLVPLVSGSTFLFPLDLRESVLVHGILLVALYLLACRVPNRSNNQNKHRIYTFLIPCYTNGSY